MRTTTKLNLPASPSSRPVAGRRHGAVQLKRDRVIYFLANLGYQRGAYLNLEVVIHKAARRRNSRNRWNSLIAEFLDAIDDTAKGRSGLPCMRNHIFPSPDFEAARQVICGVKLCEHESTPDQYPSFGQLYLPRMMFGAQAALSPNVELLGRAASSAQTLTQGDLGHCAAATSIVLIRTSETSVSTVETAAMTGVRLKLVPRGGFEVKKMTVYFQTLNGRPTAAATNRNTNKIFLWTSSVPE